MELTRKFQFPSLANSPSLYIFILIHICILSYHTAFAAPLAAAVDKSAAPSATSYLLPSKTDVKLSSEIGDIADTDLVGENDSTASNKLAASLLSAMYNKIITNRLHSLLQGIEPPDQQPLTGGPSSYNDEIADVQTFKLSQPQNFADNDFVLENEWTYKDESLVEVVATFADRSSLSASDSATIVVNLPHPVTEIPLAQLKKLPGGTFVTNKNFT